MTRIEGKAILVNKSAEEVHDFLANLNNHKQIMPDQVSDWESDENTCVYTIKGTGTVHLKVSSRSKGEKVILEPNGRIPFPFTLEWNTVSSGAQTQVQPVMNADLNPVIKMIASKPLQNFINMQVQNLEALMND